MFAEKTQVPADRTRTEIERLLAKHKASQYLTAVDHEAHRAVVQFKMANRVVRFNVGLPAPAKYPSRGNVKQVEQAERQRWRALLLVLKAKMEAIENSISTFDSEFLSHIVVPGAGGRTVGEYLAPQLQAAYEKGSGPLMLSAGEEAGR